MKTEKIYVDSLGHCHRIDDGTMIVIETDFFVGRCDAVVEGYCYDTSEGYSQIYPWKDMDELDNTQWEYEREKLADAENALAILLGGAV